MSYHVISYRIISKSYHMYSHVTNSFFLSCAVSLWSVAVNLTCAYQYLSHRANGRMAWETVWDNKLGQMEPATVVSVLPEFLRLEIATTIFMGDNYSFFAPFWPRCVVVYVFFLMVRLLFKHKCQQLKTETAEINVTQRSVTRWIQMLI